jgi:hypothetical protein
MKHLALALLLVACGSKDENHFGTWKKADSQAALQGAWVGPSTGNAIAKAAYEITGDVVKMWNGTEEKTYKLVFDAPCKIGMQEPGASGMTIYFGLVMKDGKPMWGAGNAGQRTGDTAIMCAGLTNWVVAKGNTCKEQSMSGRWESDAKCGIRKKADGTEEAFWTWMNKEETAPMDGDYLWAFKDDPAQKMADYAAAKAALAEKK